MCLCEEREVGKQLFVPRPEECMCLCSRVLKLFLSFVMFRPAHLSLTWSKDPHWPLTNTHTHAYIPDGQITGHGENHLQQGLNYTQTSASCCPLLGQDCLLQVTTLLDTLLMQLQSETCYTCEEMKALLSGTRSEELKLPVCERGRQAKWTVDTGGIQCFPSCPWWLLTPA